MKKLFVLGLAICGVLGFSLTVDSSAKNITVGTGGTYSTISAARANCLSGDRIYILPGNYVECNIGPTGIDSTIVQAQIFGTATIDGRTGIGNVAPDFAQTFSWSGCHFNTLQGLVIIANAGGDAIQNYSNSSGNLLTDCLIVGSYPSDNTTGPAFANIISYGGPIDFQVRNNTIVNGTGIGYRQYSANPIGGFITKNNIFANLGTGIQSASAWDGIANNYNIFYNVATPVGTGVMGANDLTSNPLFVTASTDFHLQAGSPALFSGENGQTRGARWLGLEAGNNTNTLFLNHFDSATAKADYTKATGGVMNALMGTRPYDHATTKFGGGSLLVAAGLNLTGTDQTYPLYTTGQWILNPHEGTLDYWIYQGAFDNGYIAQGPFIYQASPLIDWREQRTSSYVLQPYTATTTSWAHSVDSSNYLPLWPTPGWTHFAHTWSSLKNRSDLYMNGVLISSAFGTVSATSYGVSDAMWQSQILHMFGLQGSAGYQYTGGHIDEMRISDIDRYNGASFTPNTSPYVGFTTEVENWMLFDTTKESKL